MKHKKIPFWLARTSAFLFLVVSSPTAAQVVPDSTLPTNSRIKQQGDVTVIEGGSRAGENLFHSFKELSVPSNSSIYFKNASGIQNIFTRITGSSISEIDGLIRANGAANLFLLNSNGITFGKNASLDIGGSFFASTASSLKFADGFEFNTTADSATPLLTISVPIGMGFASNPGEILVQGNSSFKDIPAPDINQVLSSFARGVKPSGLSVKSEKTLGLVGGNLSLDGATLTAENGQIELGSVDLGSFVNLIPINKGWTLGYGEASLKDIQLSRGTLVDASGVKGGSIQVQGAHIRLTDGSVFAIENLGTQEHETLKINATESLEVSGNTLSGRVSSSLRTRSVSSESENLVNQKEVATRQAANILISTKRLNLKEGGNIGSTTGNAAQSGNVIVNASESIHIADFPPLVTNTGRSQIFSSTLTTADSGGLSISTGTLTIIDKGFVATSTFGSGRGGNLRIHAAKSIELDGPQSFLGTRALNAGDAGTVKLTTTELIGKNGGRIDTSTLASGSAGSIFINAQSVKLSGVGETSNTVIPSSVNSSANIPSQATQQFLGIPAIPTGSSGDIKIYVEKLNITNGAEVSVKNEGTGNAGILRVNTDTLNLDSQSKITAASASGEGGSISLHSADLRSRNSEITTSADGNGNGGNITINADTITALEKSNITANAFEGRGGNIEINATGLFLSPDSQITASSEKGVDGNVDINVPDTNLEAAYQLAPEFKIRKLALICGGIDSGAAKGSFVNIGKGGIPQTPEDLRGVRFGWYDDDPQTNQTQKEIEDKDNSTQKIEEQKGIEIVEAQGWIDNGDGTVSFTASPNEIVLGDYLSKPNYCNGE